MAGAFVSSLIDIVEFVIQLIIYVIAIRVVLSWIIRPNPYSAPNPVLRFFYEVTEPMLRPLRKILPRVGPLDLSPFVAILILTFLRLFLHRAF